MHVFTIAPASMKGIWLIVGIVGIVLLLAAFVIGSAAIAARNAKFEITSEGLRLSGDLYGRLIPSAALRIDTVKRIDFALTPDYSLRWRTLGIGLPGYKAGWFRLRNGEKALVYLTDPSRAVYINTSEGYSLLLSPEDPNGFIASMVNDYTR